MVPVGKLRQSRTKTDRGGMMTATRVFTAGVRGPVMCWQTGSQAKQKEWQ